MAEKDIIENTKAQDQKDTDSSITSLANDNLKKKKATTNTELNKTVNKKDEIKEDFKITKSKTTKKTTASKETTTKTKSTTRKPRRRRIVHKVFTFDAYVKETKVDKVKKDFKVIKDQEIKKEEKKVVESKADNKIKFYNIYDCMNNAFINTKYKKGTLLLLIKNFLISYIIANFFYIKLNINPFSFYRMTFSDASLLAFKIFFAFISSEIIYSIVVYYMNKKYKNEINYKKIIATLGSGLFYVNLILLLCVMIINKYNVFGYFLFLVSFAMYLIILITTINVVSIDNINKKINISIISLMGVILILMLFFPLISFQFLRILEIMF